MNKLGVIQIIDSLNTGGAEVLAVNIANSLSEKNINSHICTTRKEGKLIENINKGVGYLFLKRKKTIDFKSLFLFKKYIKVNNISILHAHSSSSFFAFCVKLIYPKIKIVWHDHFGKTQELGTRKLFPLKIISIFFNVIISVNNQLKNWAKNNLNCKKVYFLNNFPFFYDGEKITTLKGNENKRIIHLAAFREQKDHETLINAFNLFLKDNKEWSLHLVGSINNDLYSKKIIDLIKVKGLEKHIFVYGSCLDVSNILSQASIGVLSSKSEGLPISLLEYGLAKLPVIVTNVGECAKVVKNNKSGIVVRSKNIIELTEAFNILVKSTEKRSFFRKQHHKNVIEKYSKESFLNQLIEIYTI